MMATAQDTSKRLLTKYRPKPNLARRSSNLTAPNVELNAKQQAIGEFIERSSEEDRSLVEEIVRSIEDEEKPESIFLLLECSLYFDNLADTKRSMQVALKGLAQASESDDTNLQRKAHNIVACNFAKICDFEQAFAHLEQAVRLSVAIEKPLYSFAALCNAVPILQIAGLLQNAKELALSLTSYKGGTAELDYLHLQNAINGHDISRYTGDEAAAETFIDIARRTLPTAGAVGEPWRIYVDVHYALFLLHKGSKKIASEMINLAIAEQPSGRNARIDITLRCAQAQCALAQSNRAKVKECKAHIGSLVTRGDTSAIHREHILRTLVDLYSLDRTGRGKMLGLKYLRALNSHLVNVKHAQFFDKVGRRLEMEPVSSNTLTAPSYAVPESVLWLEDHGVMIGEGRRQLSISEHDLVQSRALKFADPTFRRIEARLRTSAFDVAEDWAVAADFSSERSNHHCFQVGRLAGFIASRLGQSDNRAVLVEMACRLHDIGKIAARGLVGHSFGATKPEDFVLIRQHTLIGGELLDSMDGPLFQLAASVARNHHEWWNGCGLPNALRGENIPLEARICLLADSYVSLIHPSTNQSPWLKDNATRQIAAMGGIQLDPSLVAVFLEATQEFDLSIFGAEDSVSWLCGGGRRLDNARSSLLKTIDASLEDLEKH